MTPTDKLREKAREWLRGWLGDMREAEEYLPALLADVRREALEEAAMLHETVTHLFDHDMGRLGPTSHPGGMSLVIVYRDAIRRLKEQSE